MPALSKKDSIKKKIVFCLFISSTIFLVIGSLPLLPEIAWRFFSSAKITTFAIAHKTDIASTTTAPSVAKLVVGSSYRLIIPAIKVDMPIIFDEKNEQKALARGAWLIPGSAFPNSSDPHRNTVISAHRYQFTTGPNTFYHLDKLKAGDSIIVTWAKEEYHYSVIKQSVVPPSAVYILDKTSSPMLTLFTCTPLYSNKNRLVIRAIPSY